MQQNDKALARQIKEFRLAAQLTQKEAAIFFGVSRTTYINVEMAKGCGDLNRAKIVRKLQAQQVQAVA